MRRSGLVMRQREGEESEGERRGRGILGDKAMRDEAMGETGWKLRGVSRLDVLLEMMEVNGIVRNVEID